MELWCASNGGMMRGSRYSSVKTRTASECPGLCQVSGWWRIAWVTLKRCIFSQDSKMFSVSDIGDGHWYGGPEELVQHFPMRPDNQRRRTAFLPGDFIQVSLFRPKILTKKNFRMEKSLGAWRSQCGSPVPGRGWRWWRSSPCSTAGTRTTTTSSASPQSTRSLMWGIHFTLSTSLKLTTGHKRWRDSFKLWTVGEG